jgi:hypothetical protein
MGRHGEALLSTRRARELDPLAAIMPALSSQVSFQARDYSAALEHARHAIVLDPEFWIGHMMRGQALEQLRGSGGPTRREESPSIDRMRRRLIAPRRRAAGRKTAASSRSWVGPLPCIM